MQKTLTQVDGNAAPGTCLQQRAYYIAEPALADRSIHSYTIAPNTGGNRTGSIRINYAGGRSFIGVNQGAQSTNVAFQLFDLSAQSTPTVECRLRVPSTACTLSAINTALPNAIASYDWRVEYAYNGTKVKTQISSLASFTFNETCGPSASEGTPIPMQVRLTVTDTAGNSQTVSSGQGIQPLLQLRSHTCQ